MDLLTAVVEDSFSHLAESMRQAGFDGASLEERISLFVDRCWEFCSSPRYQSSLQILLGMRNDHGQPEQFDRWLQTTLGHLINEGFSMWQQAFHDVKLAQDELIDLLLYLFSSLSGSALLARISQRPERISNDLRVLKCFLLLRFLQANTPGYHHE